MPQQTPSLSSMVRTAFRVWVAVMLAGALELAAAFDVVVRVVLVYVLPALPRVMALPAQFAIRMLLRRERVVVELQPRGIFKKTSATNPPPPFPSNTATVREAPRGGNGGAHECTDEDEGSFSSPSSAAGASSTDRRSSPLHHQSVQSDGCRYAVGVKQGNVTVFAGVPYATAERFKKPVVISSYTSDAAKSLTNSPYVPKHMACFANARGGRWAPIAGSAALGLVSARPMLLGLATHLANRFILRRGCAWGDEQLCLQLTVFRPDVAHPTTSASAASGSHGSKKTNFSASPNSTGSSKALPIIVFIHGGAFITFSSNMPLHDCAKLAEHAQAVVFSIEYRQGVLGFADFGDGVGGYDANCGVLDCMAALDWVQRFAPAFGGDIRRVTLMGQSAGGMLATTLMSIPKASNLFNHVIAISGVINFVQSREDNWRTMHVFAEKLAALRASKDKSVTNNKKKLSNKTKDDSSSTDINKSDNNLLDTAEKRREFLLQLKNLPLSDLMFLQDRVIATFDGQFRMFASPEQQWLPFAPIIDGHLIAEHPIAALRRDPSLVHGRIVVASYTASEYAFFVGLGAMAGKKNKKGHEISDDRLPLRIRHMLGESVCDQETAEAIVAAYKDSQHSWSTHTASKDKGAWIQAVSDLVFRLPAEHLATVVASNGGSSVVVRVEEPSPLAALGAAHACDLHHWLGTRRVPPYLAGIYGSPAAEARFQRISKELMSLVRDVSLEWDGKPPLRRRGSLSVQHALSSASASAATAAGNGSRKATPQSSPGLAPSTPKSPASSLASVSVAPHLQHLLWRVCPCRGPAGCTALLLQPQQQQHRQHHANSSGNGKLSPAMIECCGSRTRPSPRPAGTKNRDDSDDGTSHDEKEEDPRREKNSHAAEEARPGSGVECAGCSRACRGPVLVVGHAAGTAAPRNLREVRTVEFAEDACPGENDRTAVWEEICHVMHHRLASSPTTGSR